MFEDITHIHRYGMYNILEICAYLFFLVDVLFFIYS